ncbi:MAG: CPBP family intramembrane glutamic endopeptidase [Gemmatimonadaceae bacterium]
MRARGVILTDSGALRAPWRLALFIVVTVVSVVVVQAILAPLVVGAAWFVARVRFAAYFWGMAVALVVAHLVVFRYDGAGSGWNAIGFGRPAARPAILWRGFAVGALAIGLPVLALMAVGWLRPAAAPEGSSAAAAARLLVVLAPAALWEELLVRGHAFTVIRTAAGAPAVLLTSAAFGLLHLQNAGANLQTVGQVIFAGVWLAGVLLATGSLYAAWMAHLAWNWTMVAVFHAPVSGLDMALPDWRLMDAGPDWATGGAWGPEGGIAATVGMAITLTYLISRRSRREESPAWPTA